jgi:uncharacterized membrane protein
MASVKKTETKNLTGKEITWYVIASLFLVAGFTLAILSVIGDYIGAGNWIKQAETSMVSIFKWNVSWRFYGLVIALVGLIILLITLFVNAKRADRVENRVSNRSERVQINLEAVKEAEIVNETPVNAPNQDPVAK